MKRKAYDFFCFSLSFSLWLLIYSDRLILFELEPPSKSGIPLKCLINCVSLKKSVFGSLFLFVDWREELTLIKSEKLNKYVTSTSFFSFILFSTPISCCCFLLVTASFFRANSFDWKWDRSHRLRPSIRVRRWVQSLIKSVQNEETLLTKHLEITNNNKKRILGKD